MKPTVSIGIPAYNEAANIGRLLGSIIKQKQQKITIEKIYVLCDNSTDGTEKIAKEYAQQYPWIQVIYDGKRIGKFKRLEMLYKLNTSNYVVAFDGDAVLSTPFVVQNLISAFTSENIAVVSGNAVPVKDNTVISYCIYNWTLLWYFVRRNVNRGNSVHNIRGIITALRGDFARTITYPNAYTSESQYLYFSAITAKLSFSYADSAVLYYLVPNTITDYLLQKRRSANQRELLHRDFGFWIDSYYVIPTHIKIQGMLHMLSTRPLGCICAFIFQLYVGKFAKFHTPISQSGVWQTAGSTKKTIMVS